MHNIDMKTYFQTTRDTNDPLQLLSAGDTRDFRPTIFKRKSYAYICVEFITNGKGYLKIDNQTFELEKNDVYILPKGRSHEYGPDLKHPWTKIYFVVDGPLANELLIQYNIQDACVFKSTNTSALFHKILRLASSKNKDTKDLFPVLYHQLIIELKELNKKDLSEFNSITYKIKKFIDNSMEASTFSLPDLAKEFHLSKEHIVRIFKKEIGTTPYDYYLSKKLEMACFYLTETDQRIKEIALHLGFRDEYHFSNFFKKRNKESPKYYRQRFFQK